MLVKAKANQKSEIRRLWKMYQPLDSVSAIDFFFDYQYDQGQCYIMMDEEKIVSGVCVFHYPVALLDKVIMISYFLGAFLVDEDQATHAKQQLIQEVLKVEQNQTLLSVIKVKDYEGVSGINFTPWMKHQIVWLSASMLSPVSTMNVTYQIDNTQLKNAYNQFMAYFDGYKVRNESDFESLKKQAQAQHGKLVGYVEDNVLLGYMVYLLHDKQIEIVEIIYFDVDTLMRLLFFASNLNHFIKVHISTQENWKKIFPKATIDEEVFALAKINDMELFNDCFNEMLYSSDELQSLFKKPLYFNERL